MITFSYKITSITESALSRPGETGPCWHWVLGRACTRQQGNAQTVRCYL